MKKLVVAGALMALSGSALAEVGLGASFQSGDPTIYVPIDAGDSFRIEPFFSYGKDTLETRVFPLTGTNSQYTLRHVQESTTYQVGLGLFGTLPFTESVRAYFGGRVSYISVKAEFRFDDGSRPTGSLPPSEESDTDGFTVEPTVGLEYGFTPRFSIAAEAALIVSDLEGDDVNRKSTDTDTNIVIRYRF